MSPRRNVLLVCCAVVLGGCSSDDGETSVENSGRGGAGGAVTSSAGAAPVVAGTSSVASGGSSAGASTVTPSSGAGQAGATNAGAAGQESDFGGALNLGGALPTGGTAVVANGGTAEAGSTSLVGGAFGFGGGQTSGGNGTGGAIGGTAGAGNGGLSGGGTVSSTGGANAAGTAGLAGSASGGLSSSTAGTSTGGAATGGAATGGAATGGAANATGGAATGGAATGGAATGGAATGGTATGGAATGGAATGGAATGGTATGGIGSGGVAGAAGSGGGAGTPWDGFNVTCDKNDDDLDGFSECAGDCDDTNPSVLPIVVDANVAVAGNGTPASPYKTIAQAVAASYSKTCRAIVLRPGTYTDPTQMPSLITSTDGPKVTIWEPPAGQFAITYQSAGDLTVRGITFRSAGTTRSRGINFVRPTSGSAWCNNLTLEASILEGLDRAVSVSECVGTISVRGNVFRNNSCPYDTNYQSCGAVTDRTYSGGSMTYNIIGNLFESNTSAVRGGAIALSHIVGRIEGNVFLNNAAAYEGGAVYLGANGGAADFFIRNNWFGGNSSSRSGGALHVTLTTGNNAYIENNVFNANTASGDGGGAYLYGPTGATRTLTNNTFVDNSAGRGGHVHIKLWPGAVTANAFIFSQGGGGLSAETWTDIANAPVFTYNDTYQNLPDFTGALTSLTITGQDGNISVDPGFVTLEDDLDPNNDDLHLQSSSSMRDAGPSRPASMNDVDGSRNDIGAYGGPYGGW